MKFRSLTQMLPWIFVFGSSLATANTIGGPGSSCGSCEGAAYTLIYGASPISSTATTQTFRITFDVNDTSYVGGGSFLNSVAIKVASPSDIVHADLFAGPSGFSFSGVESLGSDGCSAGNSGFLCVASSGNGVSVTKGVYDFVYDVTVKTGTLLTGLNQASIKARYVDQNGQKAGALMSENISLQTTLPPASTPEPSSCLLLGSGLVGLYAGIRRRRKVA